MERPVRQRSEWATVETDVVDSDQAVFNGDSANGLEDVIRLNTAQLGLWLFLASVTMLFAGFTSAYLVRQTTGSDWQPVPLPPILWLNTPLLILSSFTMEVARAQKHWRDDNLKGWLLGTTLLGIAFLGGQLTAWRQLAAQGLYLPSSPHGSFFYILTGVHGLHLLGGIFALIHVLIEAWRAVSTPALHNRLKLCATYWHFVGGLWLYLLLVLFVF